MSDVDPLGQDEAATLEAELRRALQHRHAAEERARETRDELGQLMARARRILERGKGGRQASHPEADPSGEDVGDGGTT